MLIKRKEDRRYLSAQACLSLLLLSFSASKSSDRQVSKIPNYRLNLRTHKNEQHTRMQHMDYLRHVRVQMQTSLWFEKASCQRPRYRCEWYSCDMCEYKSIQRGNLKRHLANKHNINVKWFSCDKCEYKCKERSNLKQHLAAVHGINVQWYSCNKCEYKCKTRGNLKRHLANRHNIDFKWFSCDMCEYKCKKNVAI